MVSRIVCLISLSAGLSLGLFKSQALAAPAGSVDTVSGAVTIIRDGTERPVAAGLEIIEGDRLKTGEDSWVLMEMVDGATLTLRPSTELSIDAYTWSESDTSNSKSWMSLIKGALRSITGAIGAFNQHGYKIHTPIVTVGIRGTDHETAYYPPGIADSGTEPGVYDKVNDGETTLQTPQGEIRVRAGRTGFTGHGSGVKPRLLRTVPKFYQRHAQFDKRVAKQLKQIRERREQRIGQIRQRLKKRNALPREERSDTQRGVAPQSESARERRLERREQLRERNRVLGPSQERKRLRRKADQGDSPGSGTREPIRDR